MYVQSQRPCSVKEPGCVLTGVNAHAVYTRAMFAEVRLQLVFLCMLCIFNYALYCMCITSLNCICPFMLRKCIVLLAGGSSDEGKQVGVMVEFDDGDRGKISLPNIRLLPPGYQIHCGCLLSVKLGTFPFILPCIVYL